MPYKPTGRLPGRPKTHWYETLSARVPQDLAEQVRKYAARHRQTLSDVIKDGFTLLLQEDRYVPFVSHSNSVPEVSENMSDMKGTQDILSDTIPTTIVPEILSDMNSLHEKSADARHIQRLREIVYDTNEAAPALEIMSDSIPIEPASAMVSDTNGAHPMPLDAETLDARPRASVAIAPRYDSTKYALGEICKHGHDYEGTGQSLRRLADHECLECQRARAQAARQRKRQATPVA